MSDDERNLRGRQDRRREGDAGGPPSSRPPPSSTRDAAPPSTRAGERAPSSRPPPGRGDEIASLYRKIAEMQEELSRARAREARADEMVGQMLARVGEVEARLASAQEALQDAEVRAIEAEERAADIGEVLGKERRDAEALRAEAKELRQERDGALLREELIEVELEAARAEAVELRMALARSERTSSIAPDDLSSLRTERDALAAEARHLRAAVDGVGRALAELERNLEGAGQRALTDIPISGARDVLDEGPTPHEDEPTKIFGARERELVRSLGRGPQQT